jgi:hypothetical protein
MPRPVRIKAVKYVHAFTVQLDFTDGTKKEIDLLPYLHGPIFEPLRNDPLMFQTVKVDGRMGTIVWANGADTDPDVLYKGLTPAWVDEETPITAQSTEIRDQR